MSKLDDNNNKQKGKPVRRFFSVLMIIIACFLTYVSAQQLMTTLKLKRDIEQVKIDMGTLDQQTEHLEKQKAQLEDEEYVKQYARGKYLLTKDGEILFVHGSDEEDPEK